MVSMWDRIASPFGGNIFAGISLFVLLGVFGMWFLSYVINFVFGTKMIGITLPVIYFSVAAFMALISKFIVTGMNWKELILSAAAIAGIVLFVAVLLPQLAPSAFQASLISTKMAVMSMISP